MARAFEKPLRCRNRVKNNVHPEFAYAVPHECGKACPGRAASFVHSTKLMKAYGVSTHPQVNMAYPIRDQWMRGPD